MYRAVLCVLVVGFAACDAGEPASRAERADSAGVVIVQNRGPDEPIQVSLTKSLVLGGKDEGPESFYEVYPRQLSTGPDGQIAVLNRQAGEVVLFSKEGQHYATLGQSGEGPGEFSYPSSVALLANSEVQVYDYQKRALVRFDRTGSVLEQQQLTVPFNGLDMGGTESGFVLLSQTAPRGDGVQTRRVLHLGTQDTVQLGPTLTTDVKSISYESCGVRLTQPPLFAAPMLWATSATRTAVVSGPHYSVLVFDGTELSMIVRRDLPPESVSEATVARELGDGEEWDIGGRTCVVPVEEVIEQRGFASLLPLIDNVAVAPSGQIWVRRRNADRPGMSVDIFAADGEYLGSTADGQVFPSRFLPDGRIIAIERDDVDVDRVVVFEVDVRRSS
jgi:6-bladed beta-propeller